MKILNSKTKYFVLLLLIIILIAFIYILLLPMSPEDARAELEEKDIPYNHRYFTVYAFSQDIHVMELFLTAGMDPNVVWRGKTALFTAIEKGKLEHAKLLLENGADIDKRDETDRTILMLACFEGYDLSIINFLLNHGADIHAMREGNKQTPLELASSQGHEEIVKFLLENGADPNYGDEEAELNNSETTALTEAVTGRFPAVVELLLAHDANANIMVIDGFSVIDFAEMSIKFDKTPLLDFAESSVKYACPGPEKDNSQLIVEMLKKHIDKS